MNRRFRVDQLFTALLLTLLAACSTDKSSPEEQVKSALAAFETAAEARSLSGMMAHISDDYRDHEGRTKKQIQQIAQVYLLQNQQIHIFTKISSLQITDGQAIVEVSAGMAARESDLNAQAGQMNADLHRFALVLTDEGDSWKIISASWSRGW